MEFEEGEGVLDPQQIEEGVGLKNDLGVSKVGPRGSLNTF